MLVFVGKRKTKTKQNTQYWKCTSKGRRQHLGRLPLCREADVAQDISLMMPNVGIAKLSQQCCQPLHLPTYVLLLSSYTSAPCFHLPSLCLGLHRPHFTLGYHLAFSQPEITSVRQYLMLSSLSRVPVFLANGTIRSFDSITTALILKGSCLTGNTVFTFFLALAEISYCYSPAKRNHRIGLWN